MGKRALAMTEGQFQDQVVATFRAFGWLVYHTYDSRKSAKGFPDLVCAHPTRGVVWAELKSEKGVVSDDQKCWIDTCAQHHPIHVWRPHDYDVILHLARTGKSGTHEHRC